MSTPRYVISTTFRGRTKTETWDSESPMTLGRTERGPLWVIENTPKGEVRVRSLGREIGEISNAHSHLLTPEQMKKGVQVKFKKKDNEEIRLEIRSMRDLHPQFYRETGGVDFSRGFQVYHCVGDWNTQSTRHSKEYIGKLHGEEVFRVVADGAKASIRATKSGLLVEINGNIRSLDGNGEFSVSAAEFFKASVRFGYASWYFASASESRKDKIFDIPDRPFENRDFFRYAAGAMLSLLLFFGGAALVPKPEKEEVIPPQILKVLVQKKKEKVAPKKEEMVGEKKPELKEKALAQSEEVAPKPKKDEMIVPKGAGSKSSAPVKVATQKPIVRPTKNQNLIAGLMRGGLTKILDSKPLNEGSKVLGLGGKIKGDSKSVASALSNLSVDLNAVGNGKGDAKVAGFAGDGTAGVRGPATAGYANGVKGAMTSGTGSDHISLGDSEADVEEGLTKEEVGRVIHAHMKEVRYCYESSIVRASRVDGKVILDFTISGKGVVAKTKVSQSTLPDPGLGECIMRRLRTWQFPLPKGGVTVDVSYPFIFKTLGG